MDAGGQDGNSPSQPIFRTDMVISNFALAAALITTVVAACSTAFMFGYFTAFDSKSAYEVLQFIQYTDVLQFAFTISGHILVIFSGFGLLTVELSKRFHHPLARIDAQTVVTLIVTPLAVWAFLAANKYRPQTAGFFLGIGILVLVVSANMAWGTTRALMLHRLIPTLCLTLFSFIVLGAYSGNGDRERRRFQVSIGDDKPRTLHLIAPLARGYMFLDPVNQHIILVPEKEIKLIDHEPQE